MPKVFSEKLTPEIRFSSFFRFFVKSQKKFQKVSPDDIARFADRYHFILPTVFLFERSHELYARMKNKKNDNCFKFLFHHIKISAFDRS